MGKKLNFERESKRQLMLRRGTEYCSDLSPNKEYERNSVKTGPASKQYDNKVYVCKTCGRSINKKNLPQHARTHKGGFSVITKRTEKALLKVANVPRKSLSEHRSTTVINLTEELKPYLYNFLMKVAAINGIKIKSPKDPILSSDADKISGLIRDRYGSHA